VARKRKKQREPEAGFGREAGTEERRRLTPVDIQQKVFRLAFRGYNERDVDEFLDRVTEDLAALHEENKRLREQVAEGGGSAEGIEEARGQAEAIVRQAREHAASLVEEAEARVAAAEAAAAQAAPAVAAEASSGGGLPTSFLLRERQFLQQMAGLIQSHARTLKEEARRARAAATERADEGPAVAEDQPTGAEVSVPASEPAPHPTPPEAGVVAAGGIAAAAAASSPGPEEEEPAATAPWTPPEEARPEPESSPEDSDALLSAWESAFTGEDAEREDASMPAFPGDPERRKEGDQGEPSLRELFWGEE
jgi:cell division initiation protein